MPKLNEISKLPQDIINTFQQDKWRVTFSNVPSLNNQDDPNTLRLYEHFVKNLTIPDYNIEVVRSVFQNSYVFHPVTKINDNLTQLQITFRTTENLFNYYNLFEWMLAVKHGQVNTDQIRRNTIKSIEIELLDNQKRHRGSLIFTNSLLTSLSSLSMNMGSSDEVMFTANFVYEEIRLKVAKC